ncbi:transcription termination/antitermination factor NusG [Sporanaerobium hydrogeniformans]|uniref:Transcription termination/antitermination factor NusG n=1 Tax=Sporanaerobium hydrogeniformans TaxID=3072179 RepID=A0AC61DFY0_9FIRM|nr:transcription termination/antitermination protein NusG [Sporanaerobium hydrogeniformans]PHV71357.1 transcription termination/antitermination factor NusG [Sporanaerobium hydrogeniformans]
MEKASWYVVHTFSGYENKVKANIEKAIKNRNMQELIHAVEVPLQQEIEEKNGVKKTVQRKVFPGYVLIKMIMTDDTWYVVRNTRGVTGFVGPDSKPVSLSLDEVKNMGIDTAVLMPNVAVGDAVTLLTGAFEGSEGIVKEVHASKGTVVVSVSGFGREFPVEISMNQIEVLV